MYEMKYAQFCANLTRNLRQICATPPSRTPPSQGKATHPKNHPPKYKNSLRKQFCLFSAYFKAKNNFGTVCTNCPPKLFAQTVSANCFFIWVGALSFLSLFFWNSLFFSPARNSLFFLIVFLSFSRDFRGSVGIKNPCFFGGFLCLFPKKKQGKEGQGGFLAGSPSLHLLGISEFFWAL